MAEEREQHSPEVGGGKLNVHASRRRGGRPAARLYYDPTYGASFWYPADWKQFRLPDNPQARVMFGVDERNGVILEGYQLRDEDDLPLVVTAEDLPDLDEHIRSAILELPDAQILSETPVRRRRAVGFEKVYTFRQGEQTWKKRAVFLFIGARQVNLLAQADSPAMFDLLEEEFDLVLSKLDVAEPVTLPPRG